MTHRAWSDKFLENMDDRRDVESSDASPPVAPFSLEKQAPSTHTPGQDSPEIPVWWDEPETEDPANPLNWSSRTRWLNILTVSFISFLV